MSQVEPSLTNVVQRPHGTVRRSIASLFVATCFTYLVVGLSYLVYSRLLTPAEFGVYSTALTIGTFGQLILDGGLRSTIIKAPSPPPARVQAALLALLAGSSLILSALLWLGAPLVGPHVAAERGDYLFLTAFAAVYLLSYPWMAFPTAYLERRLAYGRLAWIESTGTLLERGGPAVLLLWPGLGLGAFVWGLVAGRAFRILLVTLSQPTPLAFPGLADVGPALRYVREGLLLQLANGSSLVRDSLHVLLVGPLFGQAWVGYYGWGLQLARIASQAFVGISARVSVPVFAQAESFTVGWSHCRRQIELLTILTGPLLGVALLMLPSVNAQLFHGRWASALGLLPLLFLRMWPSLATTPVGSLLMVWRGGGAYARASLAWTAVEVLGAGAATVALGPTGLAWSYAVMAWFGLLLLVLSLRAEEGASALMRGLAEALLLRTSLLVSGVLVFLVAAGLLARGALTTVPYLLLAGPALAILLASYASEKMIRTQVRRPL